MAIGHSLETYALSILQVAAARERMLMITQKVIIQLGERNDAKQRLRGLSLFLPEIQSQKFPNIFVFNAVSA